MCSSTRIAIQGTVLRLGHSATVDLIFVRVIYVPMSDRAGALEESPSTFNLLLPIGLARGGTGVVPGRGRVHRLLGMAALGSTRVRMPPVRQRGQLALVVGLLMGVLGAQGSRLTNSRYHFPPQLHPVDGVATGCVAGVPR
jgi:hypothetical protein